MNADVLIAGGGVAGLAAARELNGAGFDALVLEARDRLGGRIFTLHAGSAPPVELGAEFVHGLPPEITDLGVALDEIPSPGGGEDTVMAAVRRHRGEDMSFSEFVARRRFDAAEAAGALAYVEGFNAADARRVSVEWLGRAERYADTIGGDRVFRVRGGYHRIVEALNPVNIRLNSVIQTVHWQRGKVVAETGSGSYTAPRMLVTLPLGVLQSGLVRFDPVVDQKQEAAGRLAMGRANRITLRLDEPLWPSETGFLFSDQELFPAWWAHYSDPAMITGWNAGPRAGALEAAGESILLRRALDALASVVGRSRADVEKHLVAWHTWDWSADRFSLGAYSYVPAGAGDAPESLGRPLEATLFFAGEATDTEGRNGTVHGAIASGIRAARQMLSAEARR